MEKQESLQHLLRRMKVTQLAFMEWNAATLGHISVCLRDVHSWDAGTGSRSRRWDSSFRYLDLSFVTQAEFRFFVFYGGGGYLTCPTAF